MKKEFKEMLYKSLTEDMDTWKEEICGAADWSWTEYWSKPYVAKHTSSEVLFCVGSLNYGTCVYINGRYAMKFKVLPFTKLHRAIRRMKKTMQKQNDKKLNETLKNILKEMKGDITNES